MKTTYFVLIFAILFSLNVNGQNNYSWKYKNVNFTSSQVLKASTNCSVDNYSLQSDNIKVDLTTVGGMDGIGGLTGSLDSYAKSFYKTNSNATDISGQLKNLKGAMIQAQDGAKNIVIAMFCTNNLKEHFVCTIEYDNGFLNEANKIVKSFSTGVGVNNNNEVADNQTDETNTNNDNNTNSNDEVTNNTNKPIYDKVSVVIYGNPECLNTIAERKVLENENIKYSFFDVINNSKNDDQMKDYLSKYGYFSTKKYPIAVVGSLVMMLAHEETESIISLTRYGDNTIVYGNNKEESRNLKTELDASKIKYTYINIVQQPQKIKELEAQLSSSHAVSYPVTVLNNNKVYNDSRKYLEEILTLAKGGKIVDEQTNTNNNDDNNQNNNNVNSGEPENMKGMVERHNYWRRKVGSPDIQWSKELADYAQDWANQLKQKDCDLEHRSKNKYGENLYGASGMDIKPLDVVDAWASELNVFTYEPFTGNRGDGHYTQVIWSETLNVGCAVATCPDSEVWICNYSPAGNMVGRYPYKKK